MVLSLYSPTFLIKYFDSNFVSNGKKINLPCFTINFAKVIPWDTKKKKKMVCLSKITKVTFVKGHIINNIITVTFHCTLYLIQNEWSKRLERKKSYLGYLGLDKIYKCLIYFIFNVLSSSYISAMFFIRNVWELSVDLRPQE